MAELAREQVHLLSPDSARYRELFDLARSRVADLLDADPACIAFTNSGTAGINQVFLAQVSGLSLRQNNYPPPRVVTAAFEHPAVLNGLKHLQCHGITVDLAPVTQSGAVDSAEVIKLVTSTTIFASLMLANNETGVLQPIAELTQALTQQHIPFHTDATQAVGKIPLSLRSLGVDYASASAHKFHGPKGIGIWYARDCSAPYFPCDDIAAISATGLAALYASSAIEEQMALCEALRNELETLICSAISDAIIIGSNSPRVPNTSCIAFPGFEARDLLMALDLRGLEVSSGSACSSGDVKPSHVLIAMGYNEELARSALRFSLSRYTRAEEIVATAAIVVETIAAMKSRAMLLDF